MMKVSSDISAKKIVNKIIKWGTQIVFLAALAVMAYLSFIDSFEIKPSLQNITFVALIALVLNYIVWDSRYKYDYDRTLQDDINNKDYSVHRRYYDARKGWKQKELQHRIRLYNQDFVSAWLDDISDITGRSIQEIEKEGYKGHDHKYLIFLVKHRKYPKSGIKTPKDLLYALSVSGSEGMKIQIHKAEKTRTFGRLKKVITSLLSTTLAASITVTFISGGWESAALTLLMNIVILFMSLFMGSAAGIKGAKIKLSIAEQISELLEDWSNHSPKEEPFAKTEVVKTENRLDVKKEEKKSNVVELL